MSLSFVSLICRPPSTKWKRVEERCFLTNTGLYFPVDTSVARRKSSRYNKQNEVHKSAFVLTLRRKCATWKTGERTSYRTSLSLSFSTYKMGVIILSSQGVARDAERTSGKHCTPCRPAESSPRSAEQLSLGLLWLSSGCQQRQHFRLADVIVLLHGAGPHPRQMLRALWHDPAAQAEVAPSATSIMPITVSWRARGSLWMPLTGDSPLLR